MARKILANISGKIIQRYIQKVKLNKNEILME